MANREILVDTSPGETRVAILSDGELDEILIERRSRPRRVGSIVLAKVTTVRRELGAVFVDLGEGDGYLDRFLGAVPTEGTTLLVQITAEAHREKAARVSMDLALHGSYMTMSPKRPGHAVARAITAKGERGRLRTIVAEIVPEDLGMIIHLNARGREAQDIDADARALLDRWHHLRYQAHQGLGSAAFRIVEAAPNPLAQARQIAPDAPVHEGRDGTLFRERDIDTAIAQATRRRIDLASGAALVIDETQALTTIDIDVARSSAATGNPIALAMETAVEIPRQIRLRHLSGLIVIDFPRSRNQDARGELRSGLEKAFQRDPDQPTVHGWTRAGLLEITRPRRGPSLGDLMMDNDQSPHPNTETIALEALRRVLRESSGIAHPRLICANSVKLALLGPLRPALDAVNQRLGATLTLDVSETTGSDGIEILGD
jgi:ribonuclease G